MLYFGYTNKPTRLNLSSFFSMNQIILFRFTFIINSIILYIYGCVTFESNSSNRCTQLETSSGTTKSMLQCIINNSSERIKAANCNATRFDVINVSMASLEKMKGLFLDSNETMVKLSELFKNENETDLMPELIIKVGNLSSHLAINKQWITSYFGYLTRYNLTIKIYMRVGDWTKVNLTIHADVNDISKPNTIELHLEKPGDANDCQVFLTPSTLYNTSYMDSACRRFVTFVDRNGNTVSWLVTTRSGILINHRSGETTTILKPVVSVTIKNIANRRVESSSGFWAYILSPTFVIIISIGIIIYCAMKKNRKSSIPNSHLEPISTGPAYTYSMPMYHSPAFNQK